MHKTLCICPLIPSLATRTRLVLLLHETEARKPTNSGRLAAACLQRSSIEVIGDGPRSAPRIDAVEQPLLLYPAVDAVPIATFAASERPVVLVVPDGTWKQAKKMRRRVPGIAGIPCVTLPEAESTQYLLRSSVRPGGLSTFEAITRALRVLENDAGPAIEASMMAVFRVMVSRTLWFRGQLRDNDVVDGLPEAARDANPRSTAASRLPRRDHE
jgi:DTW domain-containing protein YfiP